MDARLRPILTSAIGFFILFSVFGAFFHADVPVPGTIYLLAPTLVLLSVYVSFEGMAKYTSGVVKCEGRRFSRRLEPIPPPLVDGRLKWLFLSVEGYQFVKYVLNQPNVENGLGTVIVAPTCFVESENERVIVIRARPILVTPDGVRNLMRRRKWRRRFEMYDGFDPDTTRVYVCLWSNTMHPDAMHVAESVGNLGALTADLAGAEMTFGHVTSELQRSLSDKISLFRMLSGAPEESRALRRPEEEVIRR